MLIPLKVIEREPTNGNRVFGLTSRRPCLVGLLSQDPKALSAYEAGPAVIIGVPGTKCAWVPTLLLVPEHVKPKQLAGIGFQGPFYVPADGDHGTAYDLGTLLARYLP